MWITGAGIIRPYSVWKANSQIVFTNINIVVAIERLTLAPPDPETNIDTLIFSFAERPLCGIESL
jgi:hypothetical protein